MTIKQSSLRQYAALSMAKKTVTLREAMNNGRQTAFLSHSHKDQLLACGVQEHLNAQGWDVYIDWQDSTMPPAPTKETAQKIRDKIGQLDWFIFLATENSQNSRWCPWEIGFADKNKSYERILVLPTLDHNNTTHGSEYLHLYKQISMSTTGAVAVFPTTGKGYPIRGLTL